MRSAHDRRSFITGLASLAGLAAADRAAAAPTPQAPAPPHGPAAHAARTWDLSWLDELKGRHKQVYDYGSLDITGDLSPLRFVDHYLDAHKDVSGLAFPDVNAVIGTMFSAFPLNASDAVWAKYKLGERWNVLDPKTKAPAVRNVFLEDRLGAAGVRSLQGRGVVFWQCNVALGRVTMMLAQAEQLPPRAVREELIAGFNPGVRLVPSHVMVVGLAQERGFTYMKP